MHVSWAFWVALCLPKMIGATAISNDLPSQKLATIELELGKVYAPGEIHALQVSATRNQTQDNLQERSLRKREVLHATLNAKLNFYCPNLRNTQREFEWVSYWYSQSNRMYMVGTKDIDGFKNFSFNPNDGVFAGYWYHSFCLATPTKICTYNVQAYFSGKKYTHFIMMEMVTDTSNGANILAPFITENCVDIHTNACPGVSGSHCTITSSHVTIP